VTNVASFPEIHASSTRKLVYGLAQHHRCLAFADANSAGEEAREIVAIASARTWGEARRAAAHHTWNPASPAHESGAGERQDDEPFDILELGAVIDGDWPSMVTRRALTLLPADLQARFGEAPATVFNGEYLEIPLAAEGELIAVLRARGFEVTRNDDLINTLDGRTFDPVD
jgi:hypothetical protein